MIRGSCLCGGVRFEIARAVGPFELCHCNRCRKASGSAFVPWLGALREDFSLLQGEELIRRYEAPPPRQASSLSHILLRPMRLAGTRSKVASLMD